MVAGDHNLIPEAWQFVEIVEEPNEVLLDAVVGEISSMNEDIALHASEFIEFFIDTVSVGDDDDV